MDTQALWSTSSLGDAADTSPAELSALAAQLAECEEPIGYFSAKRVAEAARPFAAKHVITMAVSAALILAGLLLLLPAIESG